MINILQTKYKDIASKQFINEVGLEWFNKLNDELLISWRKSDKQIAVTFTLASKLLSEEEVQEPKPSDYIPDGSICVIIDIATLNAYVKFNTITK